MKIALLLLSTGWAQLVWAQCEGNVSTPRRAADCVASSTPRPTSMSIDRDHPYTLAELIDAAEYNNPAGTRSAATGLTRSSSATTTKRACASRRRPERLHTSEPQCADQEDDAVGHDGVPVPRPPREKGGSLGTRHHRRENEGLQVATPIAGRAVRVRRMDARRAPAPQHVRRPPRRQGSAIRGPRRSGMMKVMRSKERERCA